MESKLHPAISTVELTAYCTFFVVIVSIGLVNIYSAATKTSTVLRNYEWIDESRAGYIAKNHYQDESAIEWNAFQYHWLPFLLCGLVNAALSFFIGKMNSPKVGLFRRLSVIATGLLAMAVSCGSRNLCFFIADAILTFVAMKLSRWPLAFGWIIGLAHIFLPLPYFKESNYLDNPFAGLFAIWAWMWNIMKYISFGSEWKWRMNLEKEREDNEEITKKASTDLKFNFIDFLGYVFYIPTMFGPIVTYRHYYKEVVRPFQVDEKAEEKPGVVNSFKVDTFLRQLGVVCFWVIFTCICSEFFMIYTLEERPEYFKKLLNGFGSGTLTWCHGQYFQAQYMVFYGFAWLLAFLDYGVKLTPLPIFISRVYLYSDMWKYFDTGLYDFLKSYIYIPMGRRFGRYLGAIATFAFIWAWHGTSWTIGLWTICNFIQISVEAFFRHAANSPESLLYKHIRSKLSAAWWRRLVAFACALSFTFSTFAIAFFLMGFGPAAEIAKRSFNPMTTNFWLYVLTSYAWIQTVFTYENWASTTTKKVE